MTRELEAELAIIPHLIKLPDPAIRSRVLRAVARLFDAEAEIPGVIDTFMAGAREVFPNPNVADLAR